MSHISETQKFLRGILLIGTIHVLMGSIVFAMLWLIQTVLPSLPIQLVNVTQSIAFGFYILLFGIGISQLIYVIPIIVVLIRRRQYSQMKGVITAAILTALLNAACAFWLTSVFR